MSLAGSGSFNAYGEWYGVYADNGTVTVSGAASGSGTAVLANNSADITVTDDAEGASGGIYARNSSIVTVNGDVVSTGTGNIAMDVQDSTIHVSGDVVASGGGSSHGILGTGNITVDGNVEGNQIGVEVGGISSVITVGGNVTARGTDNESAGFFCYGALTSDGNINITGNITAAGGTGVRSVGGGNLTIDGTITAAHYIEFGFGFDKTIKAIDDKESNTTKAGYYTYTDGYGEIWVKSDEAVKYATNLQASDPDVTGLGVDGRDFHITWTPSDSDLATGQAIFIVLHGAALDLTNWTPVFEEAFSSGPRTGSWTGTAALRRDSGDEGFEEANYDIYVVTYSDQTLQASVTMTAEAEPAGSALDLHWYPASGGLGVLSGSISHVTAGNGGTLAAINGSGKLIVSPDGGQSWTERDTGAFVPRDIVYDGNAFIAAENGIRTSIDGAVWEERAVSGINWDSYSVNALTTAVTTKGAVTVACGNSGLLLASIPNGADTYSDWVRLSSQIPNASYINFAHPFSYVPQHQSGGFNIAEEFVGFGNGSIYTVTATLNSSTFVSVSANSSPIIADFNNVRYDPGSAMFYATTPYGSQSFELRSSVNLLSWTVVGDAHYPLLNSSASGGGVSVTVGDSGTILTSADGIHWVTQQVGSDNLNAVIYAGGIFAAVGGSGTILTSEDGWAWHACVSDTNLNLTSIAYSEGEFIAGGNDILISTANSTADTSLSNLTVGGQTVAQFNPYDTDYTVELPYGTRAGAPAATVGATPRNSESNVKITQAATLPGTATVMVTASDGETTMMYIVTFTLAQGDSPSENTGHGGGSGTAPLPGYEAEVKAGTTQTLPVAVDTAAKTGTAELDASGAETVFRRSTDPVVIFPDIPGVNAYTLELPAASLSNRQGTGTLTLSAKTGSVIIPENMLSTLSGTAGKQAGITIGEGDKSGLDDDVRASIGDRPLIQLTLTLDGKQTGWNNPEAPVTVSIPYTPSSDELNNSESIVIWYIDGSGSLVSVPNGRYDPASGTVTFTTTHFSDYAVGYNKVGFNDVTVSAWYGKAVGFIAARGITTGTGGGNYSPNAELTRGQFIVMLMKAYGIAPDTNPQDNFADAGSTYYTGYLAAARRLGISNGVGNNLFAPEKEITRQEMFTLLYNVLKVINRLPQTDSEKSLTDFSDAGQIDSWAQEAMELLVGAGIISGSGGRLNPAGTATRAEMAQILYNLLAL